jgi:hypothetical protein
LIYLLLLFCISYYFYIEEKYCTIKKTLPLMLAWCPVFFLFFIIPATQFAVGTDYFVYKNYYFHPDILDIYYNKGEYVFYYMYKFITEYELGEQSIFYVVTLHNSIIIFFTFNKLRKAGISVAIVFFIFFTVTGIYHNQMNGLRAYMGLVYFPLIALMLSESKYLKSLPFLLISVMSHFSSVMVLLLYPMSLLRRNNYLVCFVFILSPIAFVLFISIVPYVVELLFSRYSHYLTGGYSKGISIVNFLSKLYYLPLFIAFCFIYIKRRPIAKFLPGSKYRTYLEYGILVWACTYWTIILSLQYGFFFRAQSAFIFFYIFPIYYLIEYCIERCLKYHLVIILAYLILPYIMKVGLFAKGEYIYTNYLLI